MAPSGKIPSREHAKRSFQQRHLVRNLNPSVQHQFGDVTQAQTEPVVKPDATTDDFGRKSVAFVERWSGRGLGHAVSKQTANDSTMPIRLYLNQAVQSQRVAECSTAIGTPKTLRAT